LRGKRGKNRGSKGKGRGYRGQNESREDYKDLKV